MKVLYFSATGNCLYLAKRIGGENLSISKMIENETYDIEDDVVGIVFPVFGLCIPPFIEEFIKRVNINCEYCFAVATYGFFPGAVCQQLNDIETKNGRKFDYINRIKMAENCITFSDMAKQKGDSEKQQKAIAAMVNDILEQKKYIRKSSPFKKLMTNNHIKNYEYPTGRGIGDKVSVSDSCKKCGLCEKICPMNNITMGENGPVFGNNCVSCGACIQNCSRCAIHHSDEKSNARYRNPHITVEELL